MDSGPSTEAPARPSSSRFRFSAEAEGAGFYAEDEFVASAGLRRDESEVRFFFPFTYYKYVSCEFDQLGGQLCKLSDT